MLKRLNALTLFIRWWTVGRAIVTVLVTAAVLLVAMFIYSAYTQDWTWTGFTPSTDPVDNYRPSKTLWDWLELLIIPIALGLGVWWLNRSERRNELKIAEQRAQTELQIAADRLREEALQAYLDRMAELLLEKKLRYSEEVEVSDVARVRTLTVLRRLDGKRKGIVLRFLHESKLIQPTDENENASIINLMQASLSEADLRGAILEKADLSLVDLHGADLTAAIAWEVNLHSADLHGATLHNAPLLGADLTGANLRNADLRGADLSGAKLTEATITLEQLAQAKSLKGATMPDGTKHE